MNLLVKKGKTRIVCRYPNQQDGEDALTEYLDTPGVKASEISTDEADRLTAGVMPTFENPKVQEFSL
jgi:hypothetical protein